MCDEWVLVKSEDELRPGMCVELRPCRYVCGRIHRFVLIGREPRATWCSRLSTHLTCRGWLFVGDGCNDRPLCTYSAIRERRLYRLIDDDTAADETATTKQIRRQFERWKETQR